MISVIKTAIITIIISFISGWLLDHYKSLAPRIFCTIGDAIPLELNNKKICAYILTIRNLSNKIIHELTLNVQSPQNNLKLGDAKITKGLKFDSSIKNNILDVNIPFLSKDDEFSVTLYLENQYGEYNKPVIILRSPENFKEVTSVDETGILSLLFNIPKNIKSLVSKIMKKNEVMFPNKKAIIATLLIILIMFGGIFGKFYFDNMSADTQNAIADTNVQKQSDDSTKSTSDTNKNTNGKSSTSGTTKNTSTKNETTQNTKTSTNETSKTGSTKTSTDGNSDTNTSISGTTGNVDTKVSTSGTNKNTDAKTSTGETTGSTDVKPPAIENTDANASGNEMTKNTEAKVSTGNTDTKTSTTEMTGNTKTSTAGTTGNTDN